MAVMTLEELTKLIADKFGETPDDDALAILENVTDSFNAMSGKASEDWQKEKARLEQAVIDKDNEWRKKYTERFVSGYSNSVNEPPNNEDEADPFDIEIDDLFTDKK